MPFDLREKRKRSVSGWSMAIRANPVKVELRV
jgi:hypothetical protein